MCYNGLAKRSIFMNEEELKQLSNLPYYKERMERIEMMKGFSKDNNGLSCLEPVNFAKYIGWLENRLFEAHNEIKRLRLADVSVFVTKEGLKDIKHREYERGLQDGLKLSNER